MLKTPDELEREYKARLESYRVVYQKYINCKLEICTCKGQYRCGRCFRLLQQVGKLYEVLNTSITPGRQQ